MRNSKHLSRVTLYLTVLVSLIAFVCAPSLASVPANAAPMNAVNPGDVLISEFRFLGPEGGDDEFIELYNPSNTAPVSLNGLKIKRSNSSGSDDSHKTLAAVSLQPGEHYLLVNDGASAGLLALKDDDYGSGVASDGGIAIVDASDNIIDAVGLSSGTLYKEGTPLAPLSGSADQSYERKSSGGSNNCVDTDNNASDFFWNQTSSNPQNLSSLAVLCLGVTNVKSSAADATYTTGAVIPITISFTTNVTVTGSPQLLLETGVVDRNAVYSSGSGSKNLIFNYTVQPGDVSSDLEYTSINALTLNGGSISGAAGVANLKLPALTATCPGPATPCSLGANNNIVIDDGLAPTLVSFTRKTPTTNPTNVTSLVFRATFSEPVTGVDSTDFVINSLPAPVAPVTITGVSPSPATVVSSTYDVTISGGDLLSHTYNGTIGLNLELAPTMNITDVNSQALIVGEPSTDETYTVDNTPPTVNIEEHTSPGLPVIDPPVNGTPVDFDVVFDNPIDVSTFIPGDIKQNGTIPSDLITWNIIDSGDHKNFTLSAIAVAANGTLQPSIDPNKIKDLAGNENTLASTSTDNQVDFQDTISPTVEVKQAPPPQTDPTSILPIKFTVKFSEPIPTSIFTVDDITQSGTATGITWTITDSGDHKNFILAATASSLGTLIPSIQANRVTDLVGNDNVASTNGGDNSVTLSANAALAVVISEVAWSGTTANGGDEWIELYNPSLTNPIDITGWTLSDSSTSILFTTCTTSCVIPPNGFFLLEDNETAVSDVQSNHVSSAVSLLNTGETLKLFDNNAALIDSANFNGGAWPAGDATTHASMERVLSIPDTDTAWFTNNGITRNGKDADGNDIWGTPKMLNTLTPTPTITPSPTSLTPVTPTTSIRVLINEVAWGGTVASASDEWIELYNPSTTTAIDLTGWKLNGADGAPLIDLAGTIPPSDYFVIASSSTVFNDLTPDMTFTGSLANEGEILRLLDNASAIVDTANSDGGGWPAGSGSPNFASMERSGIVVDSASAWFTFAGTNVVAHDQANNAIKGTPGQANWAITVTPTRTATATLNVTLTKTVTPTRTKTPAPTATPFGRPVINEFLPRPGFDWNQDGQVDVFDEFIEIKNISIISVNLSGWKLDDEADSGSSQFPLPDVVLEPGDRILLYGKQTNILLGDGGDTVRLISPGNVVFDAYTYSIVKVEDQSICRMPDGNGSWYKDCVPSPNFTNTREGTVPSMPGGDSYQSPVCNLPDTLPPDFLFAECRGYGGSIWDSLFWDKFGWQGIKYLLGGRWESFVE